MILGDFYMLFAILLGSYSATFSPSSCLFLPHYFKNLVDSMASITEKVQVGALFVFSILLIKTESRFLTKTCN